MTYKKLLPHLVLALLFISSLSARAGYRAFELSIEDTEKSKARTVVTTLDHLQYAKYYPVQKNEKVSLVDTWRCPDNMANFRHTCPKPERAPAANTPPIPKPKSPSKT